MGIGNFDFAHFGPVPSGDSLPLMGIGNLDPLVLVTQRRQQAHYPSWGSETGHAGAPAPAHPQRRPPAAHYPSWGSETVAVPLGECADVGGGNSLPLMGIGNNVLPTDCAIFSTSLPLMGIGNRPSKGRPSILRQPHYPSWGSETAAGIGRRQAADPHYPSWGSETRCTGRRPGCCAPHYPSWGSETSTASGIASARADLITPHGDRKPGVTNVMRRFIDQVSLPLMRIGNRWDGRGADARPSGPGSGLITPHGDRKPLSRRDLMVPLCRLVTITRVLDTANGRAGRDLCA